MIVHHLQRTSAVNRLQRETAINRLPRMFRKSLLKKLKKWCHQLYPLEVCFTVLDLRDKFALALHWHKLFILDYLYGVASEASKKVTEKVSETATTLKKTVEEKVQQRCLKEVYLILLLITPCFFSQLSVTWIASKMTFYRRKEKGKVGSKYTTMMNTRVILTNQIFILLTKPLILRALERYTYACPWLWWKSSLTFQAHWLSIYFM